MKIKEMSHKTFNSLQKIGISRKNKVCTCYNRKLDGIQIFVVKDPFLFKLYYVDWEDSIKADGKFLKEFYNLCDECPELDVHTILELAML